MDFMTKMLQAAKDKRKSILAKAKTDKMEREEKSKTGNTTAVAHYHRKTALQSWQCIERIEV